MRYNNMETRVDVKLNLPKDLQWKIFGVLVKDLSFGSSAEDSIPDEFGVVDIIRRRDLNALLELQDKLNPRCIVGLSGGNEAIFYAYYQLSVFLKKFPFTTTGARQAAIDSFEAAEKQCLLFNEQNFRSLIAMSTRHPDFLSVIEDVRSDILKLLGEFPNLDCIYGHAKHGPGVSIGADYSKGKTTSYYKWSNLPYTVTEGALPYAREAITSDPRWIGALDDWYRQKFSIPIGHPINMESFWNSILQVVDGSRITTVPKSAQTERTIAIEPVLNVYLQLGIDYVLRSRLRERWGYDLDSQVRNQELACQSSIDDQHTTIDLKAASDTVATLLCEIFLPPAWYDLLCDLRCKVGELDGKKYTFAKISSMGNGFTFALESLIFGSLVRLAIRRTASKRESAVYGDDLVVPTTATPYLLEMLKMCGFSINTEKSYFSGPFRESCGTDYLRGTNVRPLFLKRSLTSIMDILYIHNSFFKRAREQPWYWDITFSETLRLLRKYLPVEFRKHFYGPVSDSLDTYMFSTRKLPRNKFGQRCYQTIQPIARLYNGSTAFFFRKLMAPLGRSSPINKWDWRNKKLNTGNAFDVTKRGYTRYKRVKVALP